MLKSFAGDVIDAADPWRRHVDLARIALGIGDEFGNCFGRHGWIHHHHRGNAKNAGNRLDVALKVEVQRVVKRRVDRVGLGDPQQRVAVGGCVHDRVGGHIGACSSAVFDDELLPELLRQSLRYEPCADVRRRAGWKTDDDMNGTYRIIQCMRTPICYGQCTGARNKT
jgi:hypothetical protein